MADPIHTKDGRVLWTLGPRGPEPNSGGPTTRSEVEQACGCEVQAAERNGYMMQIFKLQVSLLRAEDAAGEQRAALDHHFLRDAEHLSTIGELAGMVLGRLDPTTQCEYCGLPFEHGPCPQCNANDHELRTALAEARAEVERLRGELSKDVWASEAFTRRYVQECTSGYVTLENERDKALAEVERLRAELETDRKNGQDQWLWANGADGPTYNHRRDDSPETPCELCKARAEVERLRDGYMMLPEDLEVQRLRGEVGRLTRERDAMAWVVEAARAYIDALCGDGTQTEEAASANLHAAQAALNSPQPDQPTPPEPAAEPQRCGNCEYWDPMQDHCGRCLQFGIAAPFTAGAACPKWLHAGHEAEPAAGPCPHTNTTEYRDGVEDCDDCGEQLRGADIDLDVMHGSEGGERRCSTCSSMLDEPRLGDGTERLCRWLTITVEQDWGGCCDWTPRTKGGE